MLLGRNLAVCAEQNLKRFMIARFLQLRHCTIKSVGPCWKSEELLHGSIWSQKARLEVRAAKAGAAEPRQLQGADDTASGGLTSVPGTQVIPRFPVFSAHLARLCRHVIGHASGSGYFFRAYGRVMQGPFRYGMPISMHHDMQAGMGEGRVAPQASEPQSSVGADLEAPMTNPQVRE